MTKLFEMGYTNFEVNLDSVRACGPHNINSIIDMVVEKMSMV